MISPDMKQFKQILNHFPEMVYWRDIKKNCFIACNQKFVKFLDADSIESVLGKSGYDFFDKKLVDLFRRYEQMAISTGKAVTFHDEINHPKTGQTNIDVTIAPIFTESGEITTVICYGKSHMQLANKPWQDAIKLIRKENMPAIVNASKYFLNTDNGEVKLTKRETECCLYILKGLTSKEIAKEMSLSPKTIDNYLESVKAKLNCIARTDINKKLIEYNFIEHF